MITPRAFIQEKLRQEVIAHRLIDESNAVDRLYSSLMEDHVSMGLNKLWRDMFSGTTLSSRKQITNIIYDPIELKKKYKVDPCGHLYYSDKPPLDLVVSSDIGFDRNWDTSTYLRTYPYYHHFNLARDTHCRYTILNEFGTELAEYLSNFGNRRNRFLAFVETAKKWELHKQERLEQLDNELVETTISLNPPATYYPDNLNKSTITSIRLKITNTRSGIKILLNTMNDYCSFTSIDLMYQLEAPLIQGLQQLKETILDSSTSLDGLLKPINSARADLNKYLLINDI